MYDMCRQLQLVDGDDCSNAAKWIIIVASSTRLVGCTYCPLLMLVFLYHHLTHDSHVVVLLAAPLYPTGRLLRE